MDDVAQPFSNSLVQAKVKWQINPVLRMTSTFLGCFAIVLPDP